MPDENETRKEWLDRAHAVGRAQARHFWLTLIATLFFFALRTSPGIDQFVRVPIVDLELPVKSLLGVGPIILALFVIAAIGSMAAWGHALEQYLGAKWKDAATRIDHAPTIIDFALIAFKGASLRIGKLVELFIYPTFLVVVLVEAIAECAWLYASDAPFRCVLLGIAAPIVVAATLLVGRFWWERLIQFKPVPPTG